MHRAGVAVRDIKLENILLDGGSRPLIKLCDFGLSKHKEFESRPQSRVGTTNYLSPEMIKEEDLPYDGQVRASHNSHCKRTAFPVHLMYWHVVHARLSNGNLLEECLAKVYNFP